MGWFRQLLGLEPIGIEKKDVLPWRGSMLSTENGANFVTNQITVAQASDIIALTGRNSVGLAATWSCINLIAGTIGSLPLKVYRKRGEVKEVATDHPLYWLLHDSPNYDQSPMDFWEFAAASVELHGNAYATIERGVGGGAIALLPLRPDSVRVKRNDAGELEYRWTKDGREYVRSNRDMLHIRGPLGDGVTGVSTLANCRGVFDAAIEADRASETVFANGIRSSGIFRTDPSVKLTREQREEFDEYLKKRYIGAMNQGRPLLLDGGMDFKSLSMSPEDVQMLESRKFSGEEICRVFGVPPVMVGYGDKSSNWGTGVEQQMLIFEKMTLSKRLKRIEQAVEKQLLSRAERASGISVEFVVEGLLRGDTQNRATFYESALRNKWRTINEVRALENLPPVPWGDRPWGQEQDIQLQEDGSVQPAGGQEVE